LPSANVAIADKGAKTCNFSSNPTITTTTHEVKQVENRLISLYKQTPNKINTLDKIKIVGGVQSREQQKINLCIDKITKWSRFKANR